MRGNDSHLCQYYCWKCQADFKNKKEQADHVCPEDEE